MYFEPNGHSFLESHVADSIIDRPQLKLQTKLPYDKKTEGELEELHKFIAGKLDEIAKSIDETDGVTPVTGECSLNMHVYISL